MTTMPTTDKQTNNLPIFPVSRMLQNVSSLKKKTGPGQNFEKKKQVEHRTLPSQAYSLPPRLVGREHTKVEYIMKQGRY